MSGSGHQKKSTVHYWSQTDRENYHYKRICKENYEHYVEVNFILDKEAGKIFDGNLDADTIITNLTAFKMQEFVPGKTLIF